MKSTVDDVKNSILNYVVKQFSENVEMNCHYPYCKFPEEDCTCRQLADISYDTPLITGGYVDSFSMMVVLVFLENTFGIKINDVQDTQPKNFNTVNDMADLVVKYTKL